MRTQQTIEINSALQIVKLNGQRFATTEGYYQPKGYCFKHPKLGYFSFVDDNKDYPYIPAGGKKALQEILDLGGLLDFDDCKWLKEMK